MRLPNGSGARGPSEITPSAQSGSTCVHHWSTGQDTDLLGSLLLALTGSLHEGGGGPRHVRPSLGPASPPGVEAHFPCGDALNLPSRREDPSTT